MKRPKRERSGLIYFNDLRHAPQRMIQPTISVSENQ